MTNKVPASMTDEGVTAAQLAAIVTATATAQTTANTAAANAALKLSGDTVQVVTNYNTTWTTCATVIPIDDTIPQITEGNQVLTASITPAAAGNKLRVQFILYVSASSALYVVGALFQDSTANAIAAGRAFSDSVAVPRLIAVDFTVTAASTAATTFTVRVGTGTAGNAYLNGTNAARVLGGVLTSSLTVTEFKA